MAAATTCAAAQKPPPTRAEVIYLVMATLTDTFSLNGCHSPTERAAKRPLNLLYTSETTPQTQKAQMTCTTSHERSIWCLPWRYARTFIMVLCIHLLNTYVNQNLLYSSASLAAEALWVSPSCSPVRCSHTQPCRNLRAVLQ